MSLAQIEAELEHLTSDELRHVVAKSWKLFIEKHGDPEINEEDVHLLAALDDAVAKANATPNQGHSGSAVRAYVSEWTSR